MTEWLETCRGAVADVRRALEELPTRNEREPVVGAGQAVLVRPPAVEQVFAVAERGEVMPQKSTYFFPKLVSGLLFHPL